jgi:hypothetical protein
MQNSSSKSLLILLFLNFCTADYLLSSYYLNNPTCSGSQVFLSASLGDLGYGGGCRPNGGFFASMRCINSSAVSQEVFLSAGCIGSPLFSSVVVLPTGCETFSGGTSSGISACLLGVFSPPSNSLLRLSWGSETTTCSTLATQFTPPDSVSVSPIDSCTNQGSYSGKESCNSTHSFAQVWMTSLTCDTAITSQIVNEKLLGCSMVDRGGSSTGPKQAEQMICNNITSGGSGGASVSPSPSPSTTPLGGMSPSETPSPSITPLGGVTLSPSETPSPSLTPSSTPSSTQTPTASTTFGASASETSSFSPTSTLSTAATVSPLSSVPSETPSSTCSFSGTPTISETSTLSPTISESPTNSPPVSPTISESPTNSPPVSPTISESPTNAPPVSPTISESPTNAPTVSPTISESPTNAPTVSTSILPSSTSTFKATTTPNTISAGYTLITACSTTFFSLQKDITHIFACYTNGTRDDAILSILIYNPEGSKVTLAQRKSKTTITSSSILTVFGTNSTSSLDLSTTTDALSGATVVDSVEIWQRKEIKCYTQENKNGHCVLNVLSVSNSAFLWITVFGKETATPNIPPSSQSDDTFDPNERMVVYIMAGLFSILGFAALCHACGFYELPCFNICCNSKTKGLTDKRPVFSAVYGTTEDSIDDTNGERDRSDSDFISTFENVNVSSPGGSTNVSGNGTRTRAHSGGTLTLPFGTTVSRVQTRNPLRAEV